MIHKRSKTLERSVKILLLEGLNYSHGTNLTLSSDVTVEGFTGFRCSCLQRMIPELKYRSTLYFKYYQ